MTIPDHNPYAPPAVSEALVAAPTPATLETTTSGQRLAGAFLIANAVLVIVESVLTKSAPDPKLASPFGMGGVAIVPALIDFGIGIALLKGNRKVLAWAIVRVCFGLLIGTAGHAIKGDYLAMALQVLLSGSMMLLLIKQAGTARLAIGSMAFGIYGLMGVAGVVSLASGWNPLGTTITQLSGDYEAAPAGRVVGVEVPYEVTAPTDKWHLRQAEAARKDNPIVDRWLIRPDRDAHVLVIAEHAPGSELPIEAYTDAILDGAQKASTSFTLVERGPLRLYPENGRFLHTRSTIKGLDIEHYYALVTVHDRAYQLVAFVPRADFANLAPELMKILESFKLPP